MAEIPYLTNNIFNQISIGVGTWAWGDRLYWGYGNDYGEQDLKEAFNISVDSGIRFFDSAEVYGQGKAEQFLGNFLREKKEENLIIATKFFPYPWRLTRQSLRKALMGSIKRLQIPKIDLYQIHWPSPPIPIEIWMEALAEVYQAGLISAAGVSNYNRHQMQRAYDALANEGLQLVSNQVEYSLLNRKIEKNGLLKSCLDQGVRILAYSPLAMGMLTGKYSPENPPNGLRSRQYNKALLTKIQPLILLMKKIGANHAGKTSSQVALNWIICKGGIPIPGAKNIDQAEQNAGAIGWSLLEEEVALLDEMSDKVVSQ